jgi:hypothetical protein
LKSKMYISGRISGLNWEYTRAHFNMIEEFIISEGLAESVHNPVKTVVDKRDKTTEELWREYMNISIEALLDCDSIFMLHGWGNSRGANIERTLAISLGLEDFYEVSFIGKA